MADLQLLLQDSLAGHFAIERKIGEGGWARVFLAHRRGTGEAVAVKVLRPEFARLIGPERFHREIALLSSLHHPNILPLIESGQAGPLPYYVMPYAAGYSLRELLRQVPQLPLVEALEVTRGIAPALDYAHAHNIIHRDIKPDNVLFLGGRPVVSDFGVARAISEAGGDAISSSGLIAGTPEYMSPEQASGGQELDGRSDLYALGCVLYEMLAGQPPFTGATAQAVLARHTQERPPPLRVVRPDVPAAVEIAIAAALAKRPEQRPSSGEQFLEQLTRSR